VQVTMAPKAGRALEFGIYRDGDNNLDDSQTSVLTQARNVSLADRSIQFTVKNTTSALRQAQGDTVQAEGDTVTQTYTLDGGVKKVVDEADAIARGEAMHAKEHPEDANRTVDGVVANQCLMSTLGFADALSHADY
jgi:hypothetical protein